MRRDIFSTTAAGTEALPLEMLLGRARVIEVRTRKGIAADDLAGSICRRTSGC